MIKDKELKNFILQLNKDLDLMDPKHRKVFIMKFVLLKWLVDHHYIQWNRSYILTFLKSSPLETYSILGVALNLSFKIVTMVSFYIPLEYTLRADAREDILSIYSSDILGEYMNT